MSETATIVVVQEKIMKLNFYIICRENIDITLYLLGLKIYIIQLTEAAFDNSHKFTLNSYLMD